MRELDVKQAAALLKEQDHILILTHMSPDGDTLGSAYALQRGLLQLGKQVKVLCGDKIPEKYDYMMRDLAAADFEPAYVVSVDVADKKLLGATYEAEFGDKVDLCIDHHRSNTGYAKNLCLEECAATCELIFLALKELNVSFDAVIADCLYTGLSTDTGCFRYANVTPRTHKIAAELLEYGAQAAEINRVMFETKTKAYIRLETMALEQMQMYANDKCAFILLSQAMFQESGCSDADCDGISSLPRKIEGVLVGVTVREKADGSYKVSLRTHAPVDASEICQKMGGGGHARAAGCTLDSKNYEAEKEKLIKLIEAEINAI